MDTQSDIKANVDRVNERIAAAAGRSGRRFEDITLIAVSKTVGTAKVQEAYNAGIRHFGENKAQDLASKRAELELECTWHFIGHLQSNKVKDALQFASLIHSVDSLSLAREIDKRAEKLGIDAAILAQINISAEETKSGVAPADAVEFVRALAEFSHIKLFGLMTIAQPTENQDDVKPAFREMKRIFEDIALRYNGGNIDMKFLSMGMSHDFEAAIEEGSNMVRVGTAIFGQRIYSSL